MAHKISLFETPVWVSELDINADEILEDVLEFCSKTESVQRSNVGGYQAQDYHNQKLYESIGRNLPRKHIDHLNEFQIHGWVNINKKGDYNMRHTHANTDILLCGVYYLKVPKNSGRIRFYDPRGAWLQAMPDHRYFYDSFDYGFVEPEENYVIFFPSWLEHGVEPNNSSEDRISIAFNIVADVPFPR